MVTCGVAGCGKAAVGTVYGVSTSLHFVKTTRSLALCHSCGVAATKVATEAGFTLTVEPLEVPRRVLTQSQMFGLA